MGRGASAQLHQVNVQGDWDITFGWRFSQERHLDDATAQASHFFQQAFVVCVGSATRL